MTNDKTNVHEGHRQRLKNRFLESGFDSFETHNILEMLLFYSVPRKDTNDMGHELLNKFGSLKGVFDAPVEELIKVKGVTENSAVLIKMIPAIAREYLVAKHLDSKVFDTAEKVASYFLDKYFGETKELVYAMLLNSNFELIDVVPVSSGTSTSVQVHPRPIADLVVKHNASMVILAHNHPNGNVCPSMDDIQTTTNLLNVFEPLDIALLEHFVIAGDEYYPIIHMTNSLKVKNKGNQAFFRRSLIK